jgi:low temperature requirement protein LtrA
MATPPLAVVAYAGKAFDAAHIAERYGLFTLIVLGESVVAASAALAAAGFDARSGITAALGFAVAAAVWWIYFDSVRWTALGREGLRRSFTWGYGHLLVFAGIAATAVGVHLAADAAQHHASLDAPARAIAAGGLVAYLLALAAIQHVTVERFDRIAGRRLLAAAAVAACTAISPPIALIGALAAVMAVLAWAESG